MNHALLSALLIKSLFDYVANLPFGLEILRKLYNILSNIDKLITD